MFVVVWCLALWLVCLSHVVQVADDIFYYVSSVVISVPESGVCVHISGEDWLWYVCDVLYAVFDVRVSCLWCLDVLYIIACNCDVFSVVNVYLDHLKLCVVCTDGRRYVCCSECNVSNECNEPTSCLAQAIGTNGGEVMYFGCVFFKGELGFLNCDNICIYVQPVYHICRPPSCTLHQ